MKPRTLLILVGIAVFAVATVWALMREVEREEAVLTGAISGVVELSRDLAMSGHADIARTDRMALMLIEPASGEVVALQFVSPISPPQTISIGQQHALGGRQLSGGYYVMGITDKDGELTRVTPGEVAGRTPEPVQIGSEHLKLALNQPFRGEVPPIAPGRPSGY